MSKLSIRGDGRLILEDDTGVQHVLESGAISFEGVDLSTISPVYMSNLPRLTPEIVSLVRKWQAARKAYREGDGYLTWSEQGRMKDNMIEALEALIGVDE